MDVKLLLIYVLGAIGAGACLSGCGATPDRPPESLEQYRQQQLVNPAAFTPRTVVLHNLRRVLDVGLPEAQRLASLELMETLDVPDAEAAPALAQVLADAEAPQALRQRVLAYLVTHRYAGLAEHVAEALPEAKDAGTRLSILKWLQENPTPKVLTDVVKLWAAQPDPPEEEEAAYRQVVREITGRRWDAALLEALNTPDFNARGSTMEILASRMPMEILRNQILALEANTDAVRSLQTFADLFGYVPRTRRELLATVVTSTERDQGLLDAVKLANTWKGKHGYTFNIRDLHLIRELAADPLRNTGLSRPQLVLEISQTIAARRKGAAARGPAEDNKAAFRRGRLVDFDGQAQSLSVADLWRLLLIDEMFSRPRVCAAFAVTAQQDRADRNTQSGGLVTYQQGAAEAKQYPPAARRGDDRYVPSLQMLHESLNAIGFFVGHFSKTQDDPAGVGPTAEELEFAKAQNVCGIVVTTVSGAKYNVAYFTPEGIVIDLGDFAPVP